MNELNDSLLARFLPVDSSDIYQREVRSKKEFSPKKLLEMMFTRLPWWIGGLMWLRNLLVKPLGLKGDGFEEHLSEMIQCQNEHEIVWGMNDHHLCFYVSIYCSDKDDDKQTIGINTLVKYNNLMGKVYFFVIKPFHKMIVKTLLKRIG